MKRIFFRGLLKDRVVELKYCSSQKQIVNILTKPLKLDAFVKLRKQLGVYEIPKL